MRFDSDLMLGIQGMRLLAVPALLAVLMSVRMSAQDDPTDTPLGDVARSLRKKGASSQKVIDDDNLPQVMQEADSHHVFGSSLKFLMAGDSKGFQVSAPDVTCSLSFTANVKSLLSSQYAQMDLPTGELDKLEGPATIEGDALTIPIFNATDWHVSELAVALTVVKRAGAREPAASNFQTGEVAPPVPSATFQEVRPEKKPDVTVIYRMRSVAPPWSRAVFSAPLKIEVPEGDEWHWAIVGAKGYPPQNYAGTMQAIAQPDGQASIKPGPSTDLTAPHDEPNVSLPAATEATAPQQ